VLFPLVRFKKIKSVKNKKRKKIKAEKKLLADGYKLSHG
jgi:hypothetical protein